MLSGVTLVATLVNWAPDGPPPRDLTPAERERLATMRVANYRELRAGLHVTAGAGATRTDLLGWVAQATPTVLVIRPDPTAVPTPAMPPLVPPADGWRLPADPDLAPLLGLIFALAADRPDPADRWAGRWVGREHLNGEPVDVLEVATPNPVAVGGATADPLTMPVSAATNLRGSGWLSWTSDSAYLAVTDLDTDARRTLVRHHRRQVTRIDGGGSARPPLPPPATGWRTGPHRTQAVDPPTRGAGRYGYAATASPAPASTWCRSTPAADRCATGSTGPGRCAGWNCRPAPAPGRSST